jgi:glycosyltransferase involved in cell wall biosynthesis
MNPSVPDNRRTDAPTHRLDGVRVLALFGGTKLFGQERANIEVFRNLADMGAAVRVITTSRGGENEVHRELAQQGIEWTTAPFGCTWHRYLLGRHFYYWFLNLYSIFAVSWRVWREIRRWQPTHLYCMNFQYFIYTWPALVLTRLPLVWRAGDELPRHSFMHRWFSRRLLRRVNLLVCNSLFLKTRYLADWPAVPEIRVIHNYPSVREGAALPPVPGRPADATVVTFVGQVSEHKGVLILFDAMEQLIRSGRNVVLWIAGSVNWNEGFMERLQARAAAPELQRRIVLLGFVANIPALLQHSDMHVCPSLFAEPSANVVQEAKQAGLPSVVFPSGGLPELIAHEVDGFVCRDCSVEALMEGITYFLDRPEERCRAGAAARTNLEEKFGLGRFRKQWAAVFRSTKDVEGIHE